MILLSTFSWDTLKHFTVCAVSHHHLQTMLSISFKVMKRSNDYYNSSWYCDGFYVVCRVVTEVLILYHIGQMRQTLEKFGPGCNEVAPLIPLVKYTD